MATSPQRRKLIKEAELDPDRGVPDRDKKQRVKPSVSLGNDGGFGLTDCHNCGNSPLTGFDGKPMKFCTQCGHRVCSGGNKCEKCQGFGSV